MLKSPEEIQKAQFEKISQSYEVHDRILASTYAISRERYYARLEGMTVLDIGNGGQGPEKFLGPGLSSRLAAFVGMDNSLAMLNRPGPPYWKVAANGCRLPLKTKSFDYVILNGVLHHLGFEKGVPPLARLEEFLREISRVCRRDILIYEPVLPEMLETVERAAAWLMSPLPTFMLSESSISEAALNAGLPRRETLTKTLSQLTHPFYWYLVVMDYPWLKVPAFMTPVRHHFLVLPCGENPPAVPAPRKLSDLLACPDCRGELSWESAAASCQPCGRRFASQEGIPVFI